MTTNRLLTTAVQLGIGIPALYMARIVFRDFMAEMSEMWHESH